MVDSCGTCNGNCFGPSLGEELVSNGLVDVPGVCGFNDAGMSGEFNDNGDGSYDVIFVTSTECSNTPWKGFHSSELWDVTIGEQYRVEFDYVTLDDNDIDLQIFIGSSGVGAGYSTSGGTYNPFVTEGHNDIIFDIVDHANFGDSDTTIARLSFQINEPSTFTITTVSI